MPASFNFLIFWYEEEGGGFYDASRSDSESRISLSSRRSNYASGYMYKLNKINV